MGVARLRGGEDGSVSLGMFPLILAVLCRDYSRGY